MKRSYLWFIVETNRIYGNYPDRRDENTEISNERFNCGRRLKISKAEGLARNGIAWTVYTGDALEALQAIPDNTYNCVVTSPPYFWLRDYGIEGQIGLEDSVTGYVRSVGSVMDSVLRVLKPDGVLFLNLGDTYYSGKGMAHGKDPKSSKRRFGLRAVDKSGGLGIGLRPKTLIGVPWRVALDMIERGWIMRSSIIWYRKHSLPESVKDRPRRSYENIFMFVKDKRNYFNRKTLIDSEQEDMWTIIARPKSSNGLSTAPFPDELVKRCLDIGCPPSGTVLDPFAGSGTALRVALQSGRPTTGIEINPEFCKHIIKVLENI